MTSRRDKGKIPKQIITMTNVNIMTMSEFRMLQMILINRVFTQNDLLFVYQQKPNEVAFHTFFMF